MTIYPSLNTSLIKNLHKIVDSTFILLLHRAPKGNFLSVYTLLRRYLNEIHGSNCRRIQKLRQFFRQGLSFGILVLDAFFVLITTVANILDNVLLDSLRSHKAVFLPIIAVGLLLPNISVCARRLHDINKSGWWILVSLIGLLVFPLPLIMLGNIPPPPETTSGIMSQEEADRIFNKPVGTMSLEEADRLFSQYYKPATKNYGLREDGTPKGKGFFGEIKRPDGIKNKEMFIIIISFFTFSSGNIFLLVLNCKKGDSCDNRFGADPLEEGKGTKALHIS